MERLLEYNRKDLRNWAGEEIAAEFFAQRSKFPAPYNNLDYWISKSNPDALNDYIKNYKSKNQKKKEEVAEGAEKLYDDGRWLVVLCKTPEAMQHYGKGTKWCIAGNYPGHEGRGREYFNSYKQSRYTNYYVFIDREGTPGNDKWCVCPLQENPSEKCDIWNAPDNTVSCIQGAPYVKGLPPVSDVVIDGDVLIKVKKTYDATNTAMGVPDGVKAIARKAMFECTHGAIVLPSTLESIGSGAFACMDYLKTLVIPDSVKEIGTGICLSCDSLQKVAISKSIRTLTKNMLAFCDLLKEVRIKGIIDSIDNSWLGDTPNEGLEVQIAIEKGNEKLIQWCKEHNVSCVSLVTGEIVSERG